MPSYTARGGQICRGRMDKVRQRSRSRIQALLEGVDRGRYREALAFVDTRDGLPESPQDALLRCEVALYRDQLAEAETYLGGLAGSDTWLDNGSEESDLARRARLLRVEVACFTGDLTEAERLVRPVVEVSVRLNDRQSELRALYDLGRIARHRAEWSLAIERLERALEIARECGNAFYEGRVSFTLGYCWYSLNRLDLAVPYLLSALALLGSTENLRCRATVEIFYGCLLSDRGESAAALEILERAERTAGDLGIMSDMVMARMNAARTRLALGQYEEVERSLMELLSWERHLLGTPIELMTLRLLAITQCVRGRFAEARRSADEALRLAEINGNAADRLEARLLIARANSLAGDTDSSVELEGLVAEVDDAGTPYLQAEARIYLARAVLSSDPEKARGLCRDVESMPVVAEFAWLGRELDAVAVDLRSGAVRISDDGQLIMDSQLGWPNLKLVRETVERYWFERALAETDGNVSAASRLLGLTRNEGHHLHRVVVKGEPARPSRSKSKNAPADVPRRRPRTRR